MSQKPPPGYIPAGHHGGAKNHEGKWWYPTRSHAYAAWANADDRARYAEGWAREDGFATPARVAKARALRAEADTLQAAYEATPGMTPNSAHDAFDDHVDGPLKDATEKYVAAAKAHVAALGAKESTVEAADSELEEAGDLLDEAQQEAFELAPDMDDDVIVHGTDMGGASGDDDYHLGADHPDVHAAHEFHAHAAKHAETTGNAELHAHVHGPLKEATERYKEARAKHAAAVRGVTDRADETEKAHQEADETLQGHQRVAHELASHFHDDVEADEMEEHEHSGMGGWHGEPDPDDIENAPKHLAAAQAVKQRAHDMTRAQGIDMDTLVDGPEEEEEDEEWEDDEEPEETMGKGGMDALLARILAKAQVREHQRRTKNGTTTVHAHERRRGPTFVDHTTKSATAQHIHGLLAQHGPLDIRQVHGDVARQRGEPTEREHVDAAVRELGDNVRRYRPEGAEHDKLALHPAHPDEKTRRAALPAKRAAAAEKRQKEKERNAERARNQADYRARLTEEGAKRREEDAARRDARYRSRGHEPGKTHPSSKKAPSERPSALAQYLHATLAEHGLLHESQHAGTAARDLQRPITDGEYDAAMDELGSKVHRYMTPGGKPMVKLKKADAGPMDELLARILERGRAA